MGIQDRDYYKSDAPAGGRAGPRTMVSHLGQMRLWRVATWLIAINIAVFVIDAILFSSGLGFAHFIFRTIEGWREAMVPIREIPEGAVVPLGVSVSGMGPLERWGYFSSTTAVTGLQLWRWLTFQFLHAHVWHLLGNMIGIYFFGPMIEDRLGRKRFLAFYLICGVAGPLVYLLFAYSGILNMVPGSPLIGASAGVFGILVAGAMVAPDTELLFYGLFPVKLRVLALVLIGVAAFTVYTSGRNAGGEAAHLGGAALGYLLIRHPEVLNWVDRITSPGLLSRWRSKGDKGNMKYHGWR